MITRKCALSFCALAVTMLICSITMHVMSLFTLSKWVGVSAGVGVFIIMLIFAFAFKKNFISFIIIPLNAIGDGLAMSSLYVYLGAYPAIWETAVAFGALCLALLIYCLLTNIPFFRNHFIISMISYVCVMAAALIPCAVITDSKIFPLALMGMISFLAFFITLAVKADSTLTHVRHIAISSFAALIVIIIVVLIIISQGDGLDGFGDGLGGGIDGTANARRKRNPYDFTTFVI